MKAEIQPLHSIPWQERPAGCRSVLWRYSGNPVVHADSLPNSNSIFNSAVVPFQDGYAGIFRVDDQGRNMSLHTGFSRDGFVWEITPDALSFTSEPVDAPRYETGYDPRICRIDGRFLITWCNCAMRAYPSIGIASTEDFRHFERSEDAFLPYNRNGVLFPRKINGEYVMLSRPSDNWHTPFGDIFLSHSPDLVYWGRHRLVMKPLHPWEALKIGAGPVPIETSEGWLLIYHGVIRSCSGFLYSMGAALLDLDQPWKVIACGRNYLLAPSAPYERIGDVPNVVFPCATLTSSDGRIAIYYGCADTCVGICFGRINEILEFIRNT